MTAHDQFQITVPDTGVAKPVPFCILGQNRLIKAMGDLLNSIAQQAVTRKMFEIKKIPRMIDPHCRSHFSPLEITHNQQILFQSYVKIE